MNYHSSLIIHDSSLLMLTGPNVILTLKVAVSVVTLIFLSSLVALARGQYRLHGRINMVFFSLTVVALLGLEVVARIIDPRSEEHTSELQSQSNLVCRLLL